MAHLPFSDVSRALARVGRRFYYRGWVLGTSGNFSVVTSRHPLRLAITPSGAAKGALDPKAILQCDEEGNLIGTRPGRPSAETLLHIAIASTINVGAVLHTHSAWSTIVSDRYAETGGLAIEGFEMLKGLAGISSHEHREWIPILENDQDMGRLAGRVKATLLAYPAGHAFLLRRHGLYTWGATLTDAERHVEILEFLLEVKGRLSTSDQRV